MSPAQFLEFCYIFGVLPNNGVTPPGVYVPISGGTMTGTLNLASGADLNVADPVTLRNMYEYTDLVGDTTIALAQTNEVFNCTASLTLDDTHGLGIGVSKFNPGFAFVMFNSSGGSCTWLPKAGDLVNGASSLTIPSQTGALIIACSNQWCAIVTGSGGGGVSALQVQSVAFNKAADTGAVNAYAMTLSPVLGAYVQGATYTLIPANSNTSSVVTLAINALASHPVYNYNGSALVPDDITAGVPANFQYVSSNFFLLNPQVSLQVPTALQSMNYDFIFMGA